MSIEFNFTVGGRELSLQQREDGLHEINGDGISALGKSAEDVIRAAVPNLIEAHRLIFRFREEVGTNKRQT